MPRIVRNRKLLWPVPVVVDGVPILGGIVACRLPYVPGKKREYGLSVREYVYERDGHACMSCGRRRSTRHKLTLHHVRAHCLGGCSHPHNLISLCAQCNSDIGVSDGKGTIRMKGKDIDECRGSD